MKTIIKQRSRDEWLKLFDEAGVPCGAIRTVADVCNSDVLRTRGMIAEMPHASAGIVKGIKNPIHMSRTPLDSYGAPPRLGEHTREVLTRLLGYTDTEVDALSRGGAVYFSWSAEKVARASVSSCGAFFRTKRFQSGFWPPSRFHPAIWLFPLTFVTPVAEIQH